MATRLRIAEYVSTEHSAMCYLTEVKHSDQAMIPDVKIGIANKSALTPTVQFIRKHKVTIFTGTAIASRKINTNLTAPSISVY